MVAAPAASALAPEAKVAAFAELRQRALVCVNCSHLASSRKNVVFGVGDINARLMQAVDQKWPGDDGKKRTCSLIEENGHRQVRMANLAVVGSHAVNGVAALHSALLKKNLFPEFDALYPGKFQNKTNGRQET